MADRLDPAKQATLWGDQADPDGDGLPNSGEYLLAANPLRSDNPMATLPVIRKWGVSWLQWVVTQTKDRPGVTLDTWYSPDLQAGSWEETAWLGFPYRVLDESYTARTWEILVPVWDPQGFVRMSFTSP